MFYRTKDNILIDYADYMYAQDCKETNIATKTQIDNEPFLVIVQGNELILNPKYEEEKQKLERERINRFKLTKREVFLAIYKDKQITPDMVKEKITNTEALIEFEYANDYYRGNPLIDAIGGILGYSSADLDYLFINKKLPQKLESEEK